MIKHESTTHDILRLAKMLTEINVDTVMTVYGYIDRKSKVIRSFELLAKSGYISSLGDGTFRITRTGIDKVYQMARPGSGSDD